MKQVTYSLLGLLLVVSGGIEAAATTSTPPNTPASLVQSSAKKETPPTTPNRPKLPTTPAKTGTPKGATLKLTLSRLRTAWSDNGFLGVNRADLKDLITYAEKASKAHDAYEKRKDETTTNELREAQRSFWQALGDVRKKKVLSQQTINKIVRKEMFGRKIQ